MTNDNDARGALTGSPKTDSHEFIVTTNREHEEWFRAMFVPQCEIDLKSLWAWQEQERRKRAALASLPAGDGLTDAVEAIRKVKESLDPDDWCGDESMIDTLERAERALLAAPRQPGEVGAGVQCDGTVGACRIECSEPCSPVAEKLLDRLERVLDGYEDMPAASAQQDEREAVFIADWKATMGEFEPLTTESVAAYCAALNHRAAQQVQAQQAQPAQDEREAGICGICGYSNEEPCPECPRPKSRGIQPDYKARFDTIVYMVGEISQALGISDDDAACANGNDLILAAIADLRQQVQADAGAVACWRARFVDHSGPPGPWHIIEERDVPQHRAEGYEVEPLYAHPSPAAESDKMAVVCIGEFVCGDVEHGVDGPECGDYEIIYTNKVLDEINEHHQGKSFGIYIDRAAMSREQSGGK